MTPRFRVERSTLWDNPVTVAADLTLDDATVLVSAALAQDDAVWVIVPDEDDGPDDGEAWSGGFAANH